MLECQRDLFSLPADVHYLNGASRGPLLFSVEQAGIAGMRRQISPEPLPPERYFEASDSLRHELGALININAKQIALIPAVSYGIAIAVHNTKLDNQTNVVLMADEFPSNVYAWMDACERSGATLRTVERPLGNEDLSGRWSQAMVNAIDENTAAVTVSSVQWTEGLRFDLDAICQRAREVGALMVIDGTQSIGAAPFDFKRLGADLVLGSGYKWLLGPYQLGFAACSERLLEGRPFEHHWSNRAGTGDVRETGYFLGFQDGAKRYDVGQVANHFTVPMLTEGVRQVRAWRPERVETYCASLLNSLLDEIRSEELQIVSNDQRVAHIAGVRISDEARFERTMGALAARNVKVSRRGGVLRISPNVYNDAADIAVLREGLLAGV